MIYTQKRITSWQAFARKVRGQQERLLSSLDLYPNSILVTGCQRSGGTMLARLISSSAGMVNYWYGKDDELDAALILAGKVSAPEKGRYCFQTTYLNERYSEYFEHPGHRIIWSLRNPYSVVYSMLYNWKDFALNELFLSCGFSHMDYSDRVRYQRFGLWGVPRIRRAAYAYNGKVSQLFDLSKNLPSSALAVIEYEHLVQNKTSVLPRLYEFIELAYKMGYADTISDRSMGKKNRLKDSEKALVNDVCMPIYKRARELITIK